MEQLNPSAATIEAHAPHLESVCCNKRSCMLQPGPDTANELNRQINIFKEHHKPGAAGQTQLLALL